MRGVIVGEWISKRGQQADRCLKIIERALIRQFMQEGHDLVNVHGTKLDKHRITHTNRYKYLLPLRMLVEKSKSSKKK